MFEDVGVVVRVLGARGGEQRCPEWLAWGAGCKWYSVWSARFLSRQPSRGNNTWDTIQKVGKALVFERSVGDVFTRWEQPIVFDMTCCSVVVTKLLQKRVFNLIWPERMWRARSINGFASNISKPPETHISPSTIVNRKASGNAMPSCVLGPPAFWTPVYIFRYKCLLQQGSHTRKSSTCIFVGTMICHALLPAIIMRRG